MRYSPAKVLVVGSLNLDYIASVERLPAPGQTVAASALVRRFGGKGANQAVAASRQGARVRIIGCVGRDDAGTAYRHRLAAESIDVSGLLTASRALTGTALIAVDRRGENFIVVSPGANQELTPGRLAAVRPLFPKPDAVLLQFEIPMPTIQAMVALANRAGIPLILNPSPLHEGFPWGKWGLDTLIVNEGEAEAIFGLASRRLSAQLSAWRRRLGQYRIDHLVITRGPRPTLCLSATRLFEVPSLKITPVDTVGAGDAFAGTYVAHRAEGQELIVALRSANCAGALTTLKPGAQEAIPGRRATDRAVRRL